MADWLMRGIRAEADRLIELARDDPALRADLRAFAAEILEKTSSAAPPEGQPAPEDPAPPRDDEPLRELTLGRSPAHPLPSPGRPAARPLRENPRAAAAALALRCRRKAVRLRGSVAEPGGEDPSWTQSLVDGFCWESRESAASLTAAEWLEQVAGCFEAVAEALDLAGGPRPSTRSLDLLAEAQSALRHALRRAGVTDEDQVEVYEWLRAQAARHRVFLRRHMRADDLADPAAWRSLRDRIAESAAASKQPPRAARRSTPPSPAPAAGPDVVEVAARLAGSSLVLIGGLRRPEAQEALRQAFALSDVFWIETREHESYAGFEPLIARPEVALVLLAIRWSSHGFGEVKHLCDRHGKPLVRLPGGYSPNQVAAQILGQCSQQLPPPKA